MILQPRLDRQFSVYERVSFGSRPSDFDANYKCGGSSDDEYTEESPTTVSPQLIPYGHSVPTYIEEKGRSFPNSRYCLVASKQMVGVFLTIWVLSEIKEDAKNLKVSCVGRGLMGYLGNKGSISISMSLHQTSFCFICSHLTSGEKEGDELRRNSDVLEIIRKTRFPRVHRVGDNKSPETIMDHDCIIWLGDLNYRITLSYRSAKALVEMHNWKALLEKDQLRIEQRCGRVFQGWKEGSTFLPPTSIQTIQIVMWEMICAQKRRSTHQHGVIAFCGMEEALINLLMFGENPDSLIIDQYMAFLLQKLK